MPRRFARVFDDNEVVKMLHSRVKSTGGQTAFAKQSGIDRTYLNTVLKGRKPPSGPSILDALNLRIVYASVERLQK
jgi:hypothetical protein